MVVAYLGSRSLCKCNGKLNVVAIGDISWLADTRRVRCERSIKARRLWNRRLISVLLFGMISETI